MSLFRWFVRKSVPPQPLELDSSGMGHLDATIPMMPPGSTHLRQSSKPAPLGLSGNAASRKTERLERRELLYSVVRECMMRAGILSASYKFKVLSLDPRGRQYLIMMDLANRFVGDAIRLAEIEALVAQQAKARHEILVSAVYWRINDHVAVGLTRPRTAVPVPVTANVFPEPTGSQTAVEKPALKATNGYDPLLADEVAAFKRALSESSTGRIGSVRAPVAASRASVAQPDFEDTELVEPGSPQSPLSATQYGDLN